MESTVQLTEYIATAYELPTKQFTRRNKNLCERCDLYIQHAKSDETYPHWQSFDQFYQAVQSGCHVCRLFWAQLQPEERELALSPGSFIQDKYGTMHQLGFGDRLSLQYDLSEKWYSKDSLDPERAFKFRNDNTLFAPLNLTKVTDAHVCENEPRAHPRSVETGNFYQNHVAEFMQARSWIMECRENHEACRKPTSRRSSKPSRLISLGSENNFSDVRLCSPEELDPSLGYVTLSHTWGPKGLPSAAKLTRANISHMKNSIDYEKLPQTFRDAITFARGLNDLGVGYIWIDALCILQDQDNSESRNDWLREGSRMDQIYRDGLVNLAACAGADGDSGLFPDSDPFWRHVCYVQFGADTFRPGCYSISNMNILGGEVRSGLIVSRGWCVQELTLSERVLFFAPGRIAWACATLQAEDRRPLKSLEVEDCMDFAGFKYAALEMNYDDLEVSLCELYSFWNTLVTRYSMTRLTRHKDKLLAVSGVARHLQSVFGEHESYVVGMWGRYLHLQLLWRVWNPEGYRLLGYRAPTWSWASAEGLILNKWNGIMKSDIESTQGLVKLEPEVTFETEDRFGLVGHGLHGNQAQLHVEGPVLPARLGRRHIGNSTYADLLVDGVDHVHDVNLDFVLQGDEEINVLCLLVVQDNSDSEDSMISGLVLIRQDEINLPGRYLRVGVVLDLPSYFLDRARTSKLETDEFEIFLSNGVHKITIV